MIAGIILALVQNHVRFLQEIESPSSFILLICKKNTGTIAGILKPKSQRPFWMGPFTLSLPVARPLKISGTIAGILKPKSLRPFWMGSFALFQPIPGPLKKEGYDCGDSGIV
jgi:hypothetical protein